MQASPQLQFLSLLAPQYVARANWVNGAKPERVDAESAETDLFEDVGAASEADARARTATAVV